MKASELRIGNKVYGHKTIWDIDYTDFGMVDTDTGELPYEPIPLIQEWLDKFGFEKKTLARWEKINMSLCTGSGGMHPSIFRFAEPASEKKEELIIGAPILYVHQLQNLYFALTGNELTIKQ